jgi:alpha-L-fucosidase
MLLMTRRTLLKLMAALPALRGASAHAAQEMPKIASGPFAGTRESLAAYRVPDWFRDAKFGIWAHWGPQSAPEYGDWYARNMYMEGSDQYKYHLEKYGPQSKVGFKDVIQTWKAERFDPAELMRRYKKAGAKYFMSMGVHHDNFDLWNSTHTRWNAVKMGPKTDVVGRFAEAARREGLKFGVSDHLWISYKWFATSHGADKTGALAGVPYDGADPANADLYHDIKAIPEKLTWDEHDLTDAWKQHWFLRIKDLVDQYHPDLLYSDGHIPFDTLGLSLVAHHYNAHAQRNGGRVDAVYTSKRREDSVTGTCVLDVERGVVDAIWPTAWQTDTCVGHWHYDRRARYKTPKTVIDMLVDIVSRNGNLMLNFPLMSSGALDQDEIAILDAITAWMAINSDAIYATRPWKVYGMNLSPAPSAAANSGAGSAGGGTTPANAFNEKNRKDLTVDDVRFTTKGDSLYVFVMGWPEPERPVVIPALARPGESAAGTITNVELLGSRAKISFTQDQQGLTLRPAATRPCDHAVVFKVSGALRG